MSSSASPDDQPPYRLDPSMLRVLQRLPKAMVERFSDEELVALGRAIARPNRHPVDLRFSLPFFPRRIYIVLLAGLDRRSTAFRPEQQRPWTPLGTAIAATLALVTLLLTYTATYRLTQPSSLPSAEAAGQIHPTALPWIETEAACKGPNRSWKDGLCYDSEHRPEF